MIDPLYVFVFLGLFSPGPNVILLTRSGAQFGFWPTAPHIAGVVIGVGFVAAAAGLGISELFQLMPELRVVLQILAALWILYMAYRLWVAEAGGASTSARPMSFVEAVLFQWVNPKLWAVAMTAAAGFAREQDSLLEAFRMGTAFSSVNLLVCLFWVGTGTLLARLLKNAFAWQIFNRIMAVALAGCACILFI